MYEERCFAEMASIFTVCHHTKYHMLRSNGALAIVIIPRGKYAFHTVQYYFILKSNVPQQELNIFPTCVFNLRRHIRLMPFGGIIMCLAQKSKDRPTVYANYSDLILQQLVPAVIIVL